MIRPISPCQNCEKRRLGCRRTCQPWIEYEDAHDIYLKENEKKRKMYNDVITHQKEAAVRGVKHKRTK